MCVPRRRRWLLLVVVLPLVAAPACGGKSNNFHGSDGTDSDAPPVDEPDARRDVPDEDIDAAGQPDEADGSVGCPTGLGAWTGNDHFAYSKAPPCGFTPAQVPMFVGIGWDDNGDAAGMTWALDMHKQRNSKATFFLSTTYGSNGAVLASWKRAFAEGHEIGNHTVRHDNGGMWSVAQWTAELEEADPLLQTIAPGQVHGFRTPFLAYNDATLQVVDQLGFWYDSTIEEGHEHDQDGTNYFWPYTLDERSPGHSVQVEWGQKVEIDKHPGLWIMPTYAVIAPPDDRCEEYGVPRGLRARLKQRQSWFDVQGGKITGFDYNLWASKAGGGFEVSRAEFLAIVKYSFDLRLQGNKAPFLLGTHSAFYVDAWSPNAPNASTAERRAALSDFLDHAQGKGARVTSFKAILDWVRNPSVDRESQPTAPHSRF